FIRGLFFAGFSISSTFSNQLPDSIQKVGLGIGLFFTIIAFLWLVFPFLKKHAVVAGFVVLILALCGSLYELHKTKESLEQSRKHASELSQDDSSEIMNLESRLSELQQPKTTLYIIPPPPKPRKPGVTMEGFTIQGLGRGTAIGNSKNAGINVTGQSVYLEDMGIQGVDNGIETGNDSPVTANDTTITALKHGIKTGNNSPVSTSRTNVQ
ncbi:MAG TPA: hypothetical protein VMV79_02940, partial [Alphaproteobacteria bacterium]|nr:hypothetical protein [Alphaproteobacteria bacterium]